MKKPFWNVRTRLLLTLGLVVLPAAALIYFGFEHLTSIQRDRAVEAAFQRDFQQMMSIADKRLSEKAYEMLDAVKPKIPCPLNENVAEKLDQILAANPWISHVFVYDKATGMVWRTQPSRMHDPDFRMDGEKMGMMFQGWFDMEGADVLEGMRKMQAKGERPDRFEATSVGEKHLYETIAFFPIDSAPKDHIEMAGIAFDPDYLQQEFFPKALNAMMIEPSADPGRAEMLPPAAMMIRFAKEREPIAACSTWDGGDPEVEHKMEGAFIGFVLGMKYRGTTIQAITQRFLRTSYIILGTLSILMIAGLFFTYRSVTKAMELAKLKSDIVSNVSHELRTPLALIRLYAETLELGRIPDEQRKLDYYRIVRKESERLTALINNILDFSRIEAGKKEYELRETDLPSLVRSTLDAYRYQIEQNGFTYEEHITDDLPPIKVDREAIARSLLNLVNNAIKYSSAEKYLAVSLYRQNGSVKLDVVDHGIGIPRNEQSKIFDKFYRVCDPLCHENKGSGLGLSLVQHIVQAHGGDVSVESTPGKGSKFTVTLPLNAEAAPPRASRQAVTGQTREVGA